MIQLLTVHGVKTEKVCKVANIENADGNQWNSIYLASCKYHIPAIKQRQNSHKSDEFGSTEMGEDISKVKRIQWF